MEIMVGALVVVKFNAKHYNDTVADLLHWFPFKKNKKMPWGIQNPMLVL